MTWWIVGGLLVYIAGSYIIMYRSLSKSAGPPGLGWFAFPAAPLVVPVMIVAVLVYLPKKLWRAITR
jgi:hypothetical protein